MTTDDLSIQQKRPSAAAFFIPGAVVGGVGTGIAANKSDKVREFVSQPGKYGSLEDIAKDYTQTFVKEGAAEEEVKSINDLRKYINDEVAKYDANLNKHIADGSKVELPADAQVLKDKIAAEAKLASAEKAYNDKLAAEIAKASQEGKAVVKTKEIKELESKLERAINDLRACESAQNKRYASALKSFNENLDDLALRKAKKLDTLAKAKAHGNKNLIKKAEENVLKFDEVINSYIERTVPEYGLKGQELTTKINEAKTRVDSLISANEWSAAKDSVIEKFAPKGLNMEEEASVTRLQRLLNGRVDVLEAYKGHLNGISDKEEMQKVLEIVREKTGNVEHITGQIKDIPVKAGDKMERFIDSLSKAQQDQLLGIMDKAGAKEISEAELNRVIAEYRNAARTIAPNKLPEVELPFPKFENPKVQGRVRYYEQKLANKKAAAGIKEGVKDAETVAKERLAGDFKALEGLRTDVKTAQGNVQAELDKLAQKVDKEALKKAFEESNGTREELINKATKDGAKKYEESLAKVLKAEGTNWKKVGVIAAGAVALGLVSLIFRPSANKQA